MWNKWMTIVCLLWLAVMITLVVQGYRDSGICQ